eukprot:Gb_23907 [translate_table: standard]
MVSKHQVALHGKRRPYSGNGDTSTVSSKIITGELEENVVTEEDEAHSLVTTPPHGQRMDSRQLEDVTKRRKKGKAPVVEESHAHEKSAFHSPTTPAVQTRPLGAKIHISLDDSIP